MSADRVLASSHLAKYAQSFENKTLSQSAMREQSLHCEPASTRLQLAHPRPHASRSTFLPSLPSPDVVLRECGAGGRQRRKADRKRTENTKTYEIAIQMWRQIDGEIVQRGTNTQHRK